MSELSAWLLVSIAALGGIASPVRPAFGSPCAFLWRSPLSTSESCRVFT